MTERLGLVEAISSLRSQLSEAIIAGAGEDLRFAVGEIELEFQVCVERAAKGGINVWVVELGAEGSKETTHTVRVPLTPKRSDGGPVLTGGASDTPPAPSPSPSG